MWLFSCVLLHLITQTLSNTITCNGGNACKDLPKTCNQNEDCTINCSGYQSCQRSALNCPASFSCIINCISAEKNCESADIMAADSSELWITGCNTNDQSQCENMIVYCPSGAGKCHISGTNSRPRYIHIYAINGWNDVQMSYSGNLYGSGGSDMYCETDYSSSCTISSDGWYCQRTGTLSVCDVPTMNPSKSPTNPPTKVPTKSPSKSPTENPTIDPTIDPTMVPTFDPTMDPTIDPTIDPTFDPTITPTIDPTIGPTITPTIETLDPSITPTKFPTNNPSVSPTIKPTKKPTIENAIIPNQTPSISKLISDSVAPTQITEPTVETLVDKRKLSTTSPSTITILVIILVVMVALFLFGAFLWQKKKLTRLEHINHDLLQDLLFSETAGNIDYDTAGKGHVELIEAQLQPGELLSNSYLGEGMQIKDNVYDMDAVDMVNTIRVDCDTLTIEDENVEVDNITKNNYTEHESFA